MKFKIVPFETGELIVPPEVHSMGVEFANLTKASFDFPKEYYTPGCYQYKIFDGLIAGNRSVLVGENLYIDTPVEWGREEVLQYVARVKKTHKREFSFIAEYSEELGEGELHLPRPYMHVSEDVFFCGCVEYWNFGFFLTVLMQKIFFASFLDNARPVLVPICSQWQVTLLRTFFPQTNFIFFDPAQVVSVSNATVIGWPGFGFHVSKQYLSYLRSSEVLKMDSPVDCRRLCFSRKQGVYAKRLEMVRLLDRTLLATGHVPLYPELLPPGRMARIVNMSESVVLDSGSALFNLVFAGENLRVTLFESRPEFGLNHSRFLNSLGVRGQVLLVDSSTSLDQAREYVPGRNDG